MDEIIMSEVNISEEDLQRMKETLDIVTESIKVVMDAVPLLAEMKKIIPVVFDDIVVPGE